MPPPEGMPIPPELPPEAMNGGPPEPVDEAKETIGECLKAIRAIAQQASTSQDPEAIKAFGQGVSGFGSTVEKLMPQKPSPDVPVREEAETIRHAATLASQEARQEEKEQNALQLERMRAEEKQREKPQRPPG